MFWRSGEKWKYIPLAHGNELSCALEPRSALGEQIAALARQILAYLRQMHMDHTAMAMPKSY